MEVMAATDQQAFGAGGHRTARRSDRALCDLDLLVEDAASALAPAWSTASVAVVAMPNASH